MNTALCTDTDKADSGFTLIEVLMALAMFSIGILAVASLQITAGLQSRHSSEIAEAYALASNQMEALMLRRFDSSDLDPALSHALTSGKYGIQWIVTGSDLNGDTTNESKNVALTVNWAGSNQREVKFFFIKHNQNT